jgi:hypothetical protein
LASKQTLLLLKKKTAASAMVNLAEGQFLNTVIGKPVCRGTMVCHFMVSGVP